MTCAIRCSCKYSVDGTVGRRVGGSAGRWVGRSVGHLIELIEDNISEDEQNEFLRHYRQPPTGRRRQKLLRAAVRVAPPSE